MTEIIHLSLLIAVLYNKSCDNIEIPSIAKTSYCLIQVCTANYQENVMFKSCSQKTANMIELDALKEQLRLLGHGNLPDDQIRAILRDMNIDFTGKHFISYRISSLFKYVVQYFRGARNCYSSAYKQQNRKH